MRRRRRRVREMLNRWGWLYALATINGNITWTGELYGRKADMEKRCKAWNRQHPTKLRYVVKVDLTWYPPSYKVPRIPRGDDNYEN